VPVDLLPGALEQGGLVFCNDPVAFGLTPGLALVPGLALTPGLAFIGLFVPLPEFMPVVPLWPDRLPVAGLVLPVGARLLVPPLVPAPPAAPAPLAPLAPPPPPPPCANATLLAEASARAKRHLTNFILALHQLTSGNECRQGWFLG
jgi:hypothetical protein